MALFTVRIRRDQTETACAPENWEPYAGIPAARAHAALGTGDWAVVDGPGLNRLTDALEELLSDVSFPGRSVRANWNRRDFYVILGDYDWDDCGRYGFVAASGGSVYTRPLDQLFRGSRVFAYYSGPIRGYVGIGTVTEPSTPVRDFTVTADGQQVPILDAPLQGRDALTRDDPDDPDICSRLVPVEWQATVPADEAIWESGLLANQMVVCRLRDEHTIELVQAELAPGG